MKISSQLHGTAAPQVLARWHRHLIISFALCFFLNMMGFLLEQIGADPLFLWMVAVPSFCASVYLLTSLYCAARKLGFSNLTVILAIILSYFVSLLGLVLVISADVRITKLLKARGWKVGLFGAQPA